MKKNYAFFWLIAFVLFVGLACGKSTSEQMEQAANSPTEAAVVEQAPSNQSTATQSPNEPAQVKPSATPKPTAVPTEASEPLTLLDKQAFVQEGISVSTMFLVENKNKSTAIENSEFQIVIYDSAGVVIDSESGYINIVLPGETLGIVRGSYLEEDQKADKVEVTLTSGDRTATTLKGSPFKIESPEFIADQYFPKVTSKIINSFNRDVTDITVSAILYDEQDNIIGGGYTYLDFLPANDQTGIEINVGASAKPARVEIYSYVSSMTAFDETIPVQEGIRLVSFGYTQEDRQGAVVFLVKNNNQKQSIRSSQYQVVGYSEEGKVLATDSGYIDLVYPEQQTAGFSTLYLPEGKKLFKVVVQIKSGDPEVTDLLISPFAVGKISFYPETYGNSVTAVITNTSDVNFSSLSTVAVAYDDQGNLIGGGFTYVNFILAQGHAPFNTSVIVSSLPAKWEIYPRMSSLSSFGSDKGPSDTLKVITKGFSQDGDNASIGFIVENTGKSAIESSEYMLTAYDAEGNVLESTSGYLGLIFPNEKGANFDNLYLPVSKPIALIEIIVLPGNDVLTDMTTLPFTVEDIKLVPGNYPVATGIVTSSLAKDVSSLQTTVLVYDAQGFIIGGGFTYLDLLTANGKTAVEVSLNYQGQAEKIEFYLEASYSDLK